MSTVAGFYRYAEQEGLIDRSPAVHVRRPRLDYESHTVGLDRNELGALLVAAGLAGATEHALVSLLGLNGLRISEALGVDIDDLHVERWHRTLTVVRKGSTHTSLKTWAVAPRPSPTARSLGSTTFERYFCCVDRRAAGGLDMSQRGTEINSMV